METQVRTWREAELELAGAKREAVGRAIEALLDVSDFLLEPSTPRSTRAGDAEQGIPDFAIANALKRLEAERAELDKVIARCTRENGGAA